MEEKILAVVIWILGAALTFGLVCLSVFIFSLQFGFDWSLLICVCVYIAIVWAHWLLGVRQ